MNNNKTPLNFWLDLAALINLILLIVTGFIIKVLLPPGSGGHGRGEGLTLVGMSRHEWGDIHFILALFFVGLMVWHVVRHWNWICCIFSKHNNS
ncbi:MAG: DUF4405 domain-containing protein [Deltaproteobacteria bacterium]|nr:DUF4405 domain-containing protein [Deltaproteobacteria bacterium]